MDFTTLNNTFKINWLKICIKTSSSIWNIFPYNLFNQLGGINFFLRCSFDVNEIFLRLSNFLQASPFDVVFRLLNITSPSKFV